MSTELHESITKAILLADRIRNSEWADLSDMATYIDATPEYIRKMQDSNPHWFRPKPRCTNKLQVKTKALLNFLYK